MTYQTLGVQRFITFLNTEKRSEIQGIAVCFLTKFEMFGNVMKHCRLLDIFFQPKHVPRKNKIINKELCCLLVKHGFVTCMIAEHYSIIWVLWSLVFGTYYVNSFIFEGIKVATRKGSSKSSFLWWSDPAAMNYRKMLIKAILKWTQ